MSEQLEQHQNEIDGWPLPTPDVQRELEPPSLVWWEHDSDAGPQPRRAA